MALTLSTGARLILRHRHGCPCGRPLAMPSYIEQIDNRGVIATKLKAWEIAMLVTMQNAALISKLMELAGGDIDLVQTAIRMKARSANGADLQEVVEYIVARRREAARTPATQQVAHVQ